MLIPDIPKFSILSTKRANLYIDYRVNSAILIILNYAIFDIPRVLATS